MRQEVERLIGKAEDSSILAVQSRVHVWHNL
jgi:hypothetical protein